MAEKLAPGMEILARRARRRGRSAALLAAALTAGLAPAAAAGGYVSHCASADGALVMNEDKLFKREDSRAALPYALIKKTMLEEKIGYCEEGAERYPFAGEHAVLTVRVTLDGEEQVAHLICETLADGLPAGSRCLREVVTSRSGIHSEN